jgi:hypothetical protein
MAEKGYPSIQVYTWMAILVLEGYAAGRCVKLDISAPAIS